MTGTNPAERRPTGRAGVTILLILLVPAMLSAQSGPREETTISVAYIEGGVSYAPASAGPGGEGTETQELHVGDFVGVGDVLVLDASGYCEIDVDGGVPSSSWIVRLIGPGRYVLSSLVPDAGKPQGPPQHNTATRGIATRLRTILFGEERPAGTAAGVRGKIILEETWESSDPTSDLRRAAAEARARGDTEEAIELYREVLFFGPDDQVRLILSELLAAEGRVNESAEEVAAIRPEPSARWYERFVMLRLMLLSESGGNDVERFHTTLHREELSSETLLAADFLLGETLLAADRSGEAMALFRNIASRAPESAIGIAARRMLRNGDAS